MQRNFLAMCLVLAASLLAVTCVPGALSGQYSPKSNSPQQPAPDVIAGHADVIPGAPDFGLQDLSGKTVRLQDFRGKAVALNFWATWCVPCKTEMPWLNEFQKQYGKEGLVVVGIAMDHSSRAVKNFIAKIGINYLVVMGTQAIADQYQVKGYPLTFYIDRYGRITDQVPGLATRSYMENEIKLALINGVPRKGSR
jgi:cytochrome c biogenesis protein CcmG, thiol:disulfide interchange protein DsbE